MPFDEEILEFKAMLMSFMVGFDKRKKVKYLKNFTR